MLPSSSGPDWGRSGGETDGDDSGRCDHRRRTLIGVLIANGKTQAVTETKLEELTREVRLHNNFAQRVPVIEEQLKVANHRIADLEEHEYERERN